MTRAHREQPRRHDPATCNLFRWLCHENPFVCTARRTLSGAGLADGAAFFVLNSYANVNAQTRVQSHDFVDDSNRGRDQADGTHGRAARRRAAPMERASPLLSMDDPADEAKARAAAARKRLPRMGLESIHCALPKARFAPHGSTAKGNQRCTDRVRDPGGSCSPFRFHALGCRAMRCILTR